MNGHELDKTEIVEDVPIDIAINDEMIGRLEKAADLYQKRYLPLCIRLTSEADWVSHGKGKYYLQCSGAEKLCNPLGINWDRPIVTKHEREDEQGHFYEYEVEGLINCRALGRWGWFTGNTSSRDQFFNARGRFDEGDIRKAAFSNWLVNGVTRLAGIRNPSPDLLQRAGLNPERVSKIDYGNKSEEQGAEVISEAQRKRLYALTKEAELDDEMVRDYVKEKYGIESSKDIKRKDYESICTWVQNGGASRQPGEEG